MGIVVAVSVVVDLLLLISIVWYISKARTITDIKIGLLVFTCLAIILVGLIVK